METIMLSKLTAAIVAALMLALSVPASAAPSTAASQNLYDIPHEQQHWYDRNYPNA
jgi:Spy/CpxP family protein refolding chaperone